MKESANGRISEWKNRRMGESANERVGEWESRRMGESAGLLALKFGDEEREHFIEQGQSLFQNILR